MEVRFGQIVEAASACDRDVGCSATLVHGTPEARIERVDDAQQLDGLGAVGHFRTQPVFIDFASST